MTIEIDDLEAAHDALVEIARVERGLEAARNMAADSLGFENGAELDNYIDERKKALRKYMEDHGDEPIKDGELGVKAVIRGRSAGAKYDIETLMKTRTGPEAVRQAAEHGMVTINDAQLKAYRKGADSGWADALWQSRMEHGKITWVQLEWEKR